VVFLGSYQRADGVRPTIARGFTDHDFTAARQWYAGLVNPDDEL
jgi:prephenate dehydratase